jgi:hypothetical protein
MSFLVSFCVFLSLTAVLLHSMRLFFYLDHFDDFCDLGGLLFGTGWPVNSAWSGQGPKFEQIQLQYNVVAISEIQPKRYTNSCVIFSGI